MALRRVLRAALRAFFRPRSVLLPSFNRPCLNGWNSQAHREFTGKFESDNVSRGNVSREIGRMIRDGRRRTWPIYIYIYMCIYLVQIKLPRQESLQKRLWSSVRTLTLKSVLK